MWQDSNWRIAPWKHAWRRALRESGVRMHPPLWGQRRAQILGHTATNPVGRGVARTLGGIGRRVPCLRPNNRIRCQPRAFRQPGSTRQAYFALK